MTDQDLRQLFRDSYLRCALFSAVSAQGGVAGMMVYMLLHHGAVIVDQMEVLLLCLSPALGIVPVLLVLLCFVGTDAAETRKRIEERERREQEQRIAATSDDDEASILRWAYRQRYHPNAEAGAAGPG